jgi:hypothetical protein
MTRKKRKMATEKFGNTLKGVARGVTEYWSIGVLEYWSGGAAEEWVFGGYGYQAKE